MLLLVLDISLLNLSILAAIWIWTVWSGRSFPMVYSLSFPIFNVLWLIAATFSDFYNPRVSTDIKLTVRALGQIAVLLLFPYVLVYFFSSPESLPRFFILGSIILSSISLGVWRYIYLACLGGSSFLRQAIVIGSGSSLAALADEFNRHATPHYKVIGYVNDDRDTLQPTQCPLVNLGTTADLPNLVQELGVSEVIITSVGPLGTTNPENGLTRPLIDCYEQGVQITRVPDIYEEMAGRVSLDMLEDGWLDVLPFRHASNGVLFPLAKRYVDIVLASLGLIVFATIIPLIALAIRLDSKGPIFYVQERVGKAGKIFRLYKLRTMRHDAEGDGRPVWATQRDPRITRTGRLLRTCHLDEFPQLLNVLKGDMSAVGPRPERPALAADLEKFMPLYRLRHSVRPGMAGWALIKLGYADSIERARDRLEYDLYYIKHQSIWLDLIILLRTFADSLKLRGR